MSKPSSTVSAEVRRLLRKPFPGDVRERTHLQLVIEMMTKQAIKGNVEAAKLILRHVKMAEFSEKRMRDLIIKNSAKDGGGNTGGGGKKTRSPATPSRVM